MEQCTILIRLFPHAFSLSDVFLKPWDWSSIIKHYNFPILFVMWQTLHVPFREVCRNVLFDHLRLLLLDPVLSSNKAKIRMPNSVQTAMFHWVFRLEPWKRTDLFTLIKFAWIVCAALWTFQHTWPEFQVCNKTRWTLHGFGFHCTHFSWLPL